MDTFKCWLIANFEIAMCLLTAIVGSIVFFVFSSFENEKAGSIYLVMFGILLLTIPTKRGTLQFGKYILMLGGVILLMWALKENKDWVANIDRAMFSHFTVWFWWLFSIASLISAFLAYYTFVNFDEVTSRRMLWRNSNVNLFEISLLYTLDRFCNITVSIVACTGSIVLLFKIIF
ncbi:MAG: hypothetical protein LBN95_06285 [Prevotellaceae bacterium]|jgi:hypothetical protein|nr:hypothetical protein [Prevotellaceae bacterium]